MADEQTDRGTPEEYDLNVGVTRGSKPVNPAGPSEPTLESHVTDAKRAGQTSGPESEWAAETAGEIETSPSGHGGGGLGKKGAGMAAGGEDSPAVGPRDADNFAGH